MPKEIHLEFPEFHGPDNGGDLNSFTDDGEGYVSYTKFGEFVCELTDQGGLIAEFPENGLSFIYSDEGVLEMSVMDLGEYLSGLSADLVKKMPNQGKNIYGLVKYLNDNDLSMMIYMTLKTKNFEVMLIDENGETYSVQEVEDADFRKGLTGVMGIGGYELAFEFTEYGDDVLMSVGEKEGTATQLAGVECSNFVNFEDELFGDDPKRFHRLAAKVILQ